MADLVLLTPSTGFALPPASGPGPRPGTLRGLAASSGAVGAPGEQPAGSLGLSACAAAGLAAAAVSAMTFARRRSAVQRRVSEKPVPVINWQWEPYEAEPGSEKALGTMVGADVETNSEPWDPLGFSKLYDRNFDFNMVMTYPHVQWLRESELKHGRVAMLAFVGLVVQQFVQIPGLPAEPNPWKALDACYADSNATLGVVQISVFTMIVEGYFYPFKSWEGRMEREAGDLGFDPLKLSKKPGFDLKKTQLQELKNGRLAMIGVASMAANHVIPGSVPFLVGSYAVRPQAAAEPAGASASRMCGETRPRAAAVAEAPGRTAARYTTQVILPSLQWIKTGLKESDLAPTELRAKNLGGTDVLVGKDGNGKVFCVGNLCPHIGTPMSEGADVIGDVIVCPLHGSSFKVTTGELIDWCPSPPIIGPLTGFVIEKKNLAVFDVRSSFFGGDIEVLVDTNAKRAYEADYWKGVLDAQGKDDGTYY